MSENQKYKGKLVDKELEANNLRLRIKGDVTALRDLLDPTIKPEKLKADIISAQALEMAEKQIQLKEVISEIEAIKELLE